MRAYWVAVLTVVAMGAGSACGERPILWQDRSDSGGTADGPAPVPDSRQKVPDGPRADRPPPLPAWAVSTGTDLPLAITVNPAGQIYLVTNDKGSKVVALAPTGKRRWALTPTGGRLDLRDLHVGATGGPCVVGTSGSSAVKLGQHTILADRLLVLGVLSTGGLGWAYQHEDDAYGYQKVVKGVAASGAGACHATGSFVGRLVVGGTTLASMTNTDLFLAAFDSGGKTRWARQAGGLMIDQGATAAALDDGGVAIAGSFWNTAHFEKLTITAMGHAEDAFVARYDSKGKPRWVVPLGSYTKDEALSLASDGAGNLFLLGRFEYQTVIGKTTLKAREGSKQPAHFLARLSPAGKVQWALALDGGTNYQIATDSRGNTYLTTNLGGTVSAFIGASTVKPPSGASYWSLLARLNSSGKLKLARKLGSGMTLWFYDVAVGDGDRCHVAGSFKGSITLGGKTLKAPADTTHGFVWKLD